MVRLGQVFICCVLREWQVSRSIRVRNPGRVMYHHGTQQCVFTDQVWPLVLPDSVVECLDLDGWTRHFGISTVQQEQSASISHIFSST